MSRLDLYDIHEGRASSFKNRSLEGLGDDIGSNRHDHSSASPLLHSSAMKILQGSTANGRMRSLLVLVGVCPALLTPL